jgi:flagellar motor component MotA
MLRLSKSIGMLGVIASLIVSFAMCGGHWQHLIVPSSIIGVVGITMFGLLATHGKTVFRFILRCIVGSFVKVESDQTFSKIAASARTYSLGAGWLTTGAGFLHSVAILDAGPWMVAKSLAASLTAIMLGIYLSVFVFGHFQTVFEEQDKSHTAAK